MRLCNIKIIFSPKLYFIMSTKCNEEQKEIDQLKIKNAILKDRLWYKKEEKIMFYRCSRILHVKWTMPTLIQDA